MESRGAYWFAKHKKYWQNQLRLSNMPSDDLKTYALSDTDFYILLGITFETSQRDLDRAWRRTALKYHPDKVGNDPVAKEKFHLAQIGYDLLSDPVVKALYDSARNARLQRERKNELLKGRRRTMADDLLARERGVKRGRDEEEGDEEKLEREIRRLAEDGKRRRKEREDALRKDIQQEAEQTGAGQEDNSRNNAEAPTNQTSVSEIDRTVRIRWPQEGQPGETSPVGQDQIMRLFSRFGKIESADLLNPKLLKSGKSKKHNSKKQLMATCVVQYASVVGAHAAVEDFAKQQGPEWERFDSVFWAANKEPDFIAASKPGAAEGNAQSDSAPSTPIGNNGHGGASSPSSFLEHGSSNSSRPSTPLPASWKRASGGEPGLLGKKPSFASFSSAAAFKTPPSCGKNGLGGFVNSPSLEEMTMIRLKNAEKKRLADEIRRQDEAADEEAQQKS